MFLFNKVAENKVLCESNSYRQLEHNFPFFFTNSSLKSRLQIKEKAIFGIGLRTVNNVRSRKRTHTIRFLFQLFVFMLIAHAYDIT